MFTGDAAQQAGSGREGRGGPLHGHGAAGQRDLPDDVPGPIGGLLGAVRAAGHIDPTEVAPGGLAAGLGVLQQTESALAGLKARWITACQAADLPRESGAADTTQWLKDTCRLSGREGARQARRARQLDALPETAQALAAGELSVEHADVIARAADTQRLGDPRDTEAVLLDAAKAQTLDTLRRTVTAAEQAADENSLLADENRAYGRRRASAGPDDDGMFHLHAALDPVSGTVVATALTAFATPDAADVPIPERRSAGQRRADALVDVCPGGIPEPPAAAPRGIPVRPWTPPRRRAATGPAPTSSSTCPWRRSKPEPVARRGPPPARSSPAKPPRAGSPTARGCAARDPARLGIPGGLRPCARTRHSHRRRTADLTAGGHEISPLTDSRSHRSCP